jgi:hypothetical protein
MRSRVPGHFPQSDSSMRSRDRVIQLASSGPTLNAARLDQAEKELGVKFPSEYRRFMLRPNGGIPEPGHFVYEHKRGVAAHGRGNGMSPLRRLRGRALLRPICADSRNS